MLGRSRTQLHTRPRNKTQASGAEGARVCQVPAGRAAVVTAAGGALASAAGK